MEAELEGDAAEHKRQQHQQHWEIYSGDDDGEGQGKHRHKGEATEDQPGLVAVPNRGDGVHHLASVGLGREPPQNSDTEVETVE
jgi:hypothetical protein